MLFPERSRPESLVAAVGQIFRIVFQALKHSSSTFDRPAQPLRISPTGYFELLHVFFDAQGHGIKLAAARP
jgi:hypothetical protein